MAEFWQFLLIGLGTGAVYVLFAQGIVLIHRGSGVTNFAQAAFALIGAYAAYGAGEAGLPVVLTLVVAVLAAGAGGALTELLVMRRLAAASALTRVIATLGLLTLVTSSFSIVFGDRVIFTERLVSADRLDVLGGAVSRYSLFLLALSALITAVLWVVYRRTVFGLLTAAVAENPRVVAAQGRSPSTVALWNWALGAGLGGLAGALVAPDLGLGVVTLSLLLVPSLAAALLGRFGSFGVTAVGGLVVGIGQSELTTYDIGPGWSQAVPFIVIIVVLAVRGRGLPGRGESSVGLPGLGTGRIRPVPTMLAVGGVVVAALVLSDSYVMAIGVTLMVSVVMASSVVVTGYAGQISLAQWSLAGVGAYLASRVSSELGWNFVFCVLAGAVLTLPIGLLFGLPALRARGVTLAVVTLGLGVVVESVLFGNTDYIGGIAGISLPSPTLFGQSVDPYYYPARYTLVCLVVVIAVGLGVTTLRRSRTGRQLIAVRSNERAAAALGIGVIGVKLYAFTIGAGIAALGGGLLVFRNVSAVFTDYTVITAIVLFSLVIMGGVGYLGGSWFAGLFAVGGLGTVVLGSIFDGPSIAAWLGAASGLGVLLALTGSPDGIAAQAAAGGGRLLDRVRRAPVTPLPLSSMVLPASSRTAGSHRLEVAALTKRFGGVHALSDVALSVGSGEVVALIGPNGAGKTTLIDAVTGMTRGYTGSVMLDGAPLDRLGPAARARRGVGRSFQSLELFDDLTVLGNIQVACEQPRGLARLRDLVWAGRPRLTRAAATALETFDLVDDLYRRPSELSYGRRRLVGIARAVAAAPAIVLLDEPAAGLDEHESQGLARLLRALVDRTGLGVLLVEHDMNLVMGISDRVVALHFGAVIADGTPEDVRRSPALVEAYLGVVADRSAEPPARPSAAAPNAAVDTATATGAPR